MCIRDRLERRIAEAEKVEVSEMVRSANLTPEQLAALLRQAADLPPNPAPVSYTHLMMNMEVGPLFGLFLQSFFIGITMRILSIVIFVIVYGLSLIHISGLSHTTS